MQIASLSINGLSQTFHACSKNYFIVSLDFCYCNNKNAKLIVVKPAKGNSIHSYISIGLDYFVYYSVRKRFVIKMIKHTVMFLLLAALLVNYCCSASHCGLTPTTLEDDYFSSCKERLGNDYYCKGIAWKAFSESFGGKKPEDITERCERN